MCLGSTDGRQGNLGGVTIVNVADLNHIKGWYGDYLRAIPVAIIVEDGATSLKQ